MSKIYSPSGLVVGSTKDYIEVRPLRAAFAVCVKVTPKTKLDVRRTVGYTSGMEVAKHD